jgi:tight adherence protein C
MEWLIAVCVFLTATCLIEAIYYLLVPPPGPVQQRLQQVAQQEFMPSATTGEGRAAPSGGFSHLAQRGLTRVGQFFWPANQSSGGLRNRLQKAGYYGSHAVIVYTGAKMVMGLLVPSLAIVLLSLLQLPVQRYIGLIPLFALLGFTLPYFFVVSRRSKRRIALRNGLPDALDLMVSCVEAGLSLNAALVRVAHELKSVHPDLAREFEIANLEIRAGKMREEALRNLGTRSGVKDLKSFAAMLIQTDRFGTSISRALRVFSDSMRTKRRQRAEKAAAETTIKLVFPLVFFIFPAILIVLLGPGVIQLIETLRPVLTK